MLGERIVEYRVRTLADLHAVQFLKRLQIEDGDGVVSAIADEAAAQLGRKSDAVNAGEIRNVAAHLQCIRVHHHHVAAPGDEQTLTVLVVVEIVPASFAAKLDGIDYLVLFLRERGKAAKRAAARNRARIRFIISPRSIYF